MFEEFLSTLFLRPRPPFLALPGVVAIIGGVALATLVKQKERARVKKVKDGDAVVKHAQCHAKL